MTFSPVLRQDLQTSPWRRVFALAAMCAFLSACGTNSVPTPSIAISSGAPSVGAEGEIVDLATRPTDISNGATAGEEFFSAAAYGVAASPRVATGPRLPRGGGYLKVGSPYVVKGRRYYPTRNPKPVQTGRASWYGAAFHGRKTANGEVYDMNHLTAAHKTMPLPSYARVTNVANNRSVIVRVNDRGPFSNNRIIDLSKRAADLLDYTHAGTAKVRVEYVGPAPLHGQDDEYLIASFRGAPTNRLPGVQVPTIRSAYADANSVSVYASKRVAAAFASSQDETATSPWKDK